MLLSIWLIATLSRQAFGQAATASPAKQGTIILSLKGATLSAELADTPDRRSRGLMYRTDLGLDEGMLFIFDQAWSKMKSIPSSRPRSVRYISPRDRRSGVSASSAESVAPLSERIMVPCFAGDAVAAWPNA